jgi:S-adenosylmethionine hydrolase
MALRYTTISFLSDYGLEDEFVGVVHSVVRSIAPDVAVIDVTHAIEPHDVRGGGLALARSAQYLCPGVVLAVVDPGVGGNRRHIAVEVGEGASILLGPDNGLLAPAVAMVGGATAAVELTNADYHLPAPGPTFAGRDVFAPVAANLCLGVPLAELGRPLDPGELVPGVLPVSRVEADAFVAEVLWVDRFGNLQLNVDPDDLAEYGSRVRLRFGGRERTAVRAPSYSDIGPGEIGLVVDSYGLVSIAADRASAAAELGLAAGSEVSFVTSDDQEPASTSTPIRITPRAPR